MSRSRLSFQSCINPVIESLESRRLRSADLTAEFSSAIPTELSSADNNHVAIAVINDGDASASGKVDVSLYLSPQPQAGTGDDMLLARATRSVNLKPGHGRNIGLRFAGPSAAADGNYSLFADINSSAISNVTATDIVTGSSPVVVQQPQADLTPGSIKAPARPIVISDNGTMGQVAKASRSSIAAKGRPMETPRSSSISQTMIGLIPTTFLPQRSIRRRSRSNPGSGNSSRRCSCLDRIRRPEIISCWRS